MINLQRTKITWEGGQKLVWLILLSFALVTWMGANRAFGQSTSPGVLASWSLAIGNAKPVPGVEIGVPRVVARFVLNQPNANCKLYVLFGISDDNSPLTPPNIAPEVRKKPQSGEWGDATSWPVTLCQAELPASWDSAKLVKFQGVVYYEESSPGSILALATVVFPGPHQIGRKHDKEVRVAGVGDTGCRSGFVCWPGTNNFTQVATSIASKDPDLVFHVGDYRYINEGAFGSEQWQYFLTEFFAPANELLRKSVLIAGRGNHEQCRHHDVWYGNGWFYLFEATNSLTSSVCPAHNATAPTDANAVVPPWSVDIAPLLGTNNVLNE